MPNSSFFDRSTMLRRTATMAMVGLVSTTFSSGQVVAEGHASQGRVEVGSTLTGNYLAALHARAAEEDTAAADFYLAALGHAPGDPVLLGRTFMTLILDGRLAEATDLARQILDSGEPDTLAHIVVAVDEMKAERFEIAATQLEQLPDGALSRFLGTLLLAWAEAGLDRPDRALAALAPLSEKPGFETLYHLHAALIFDRAGDAASALRHARAAVEAQGETSLRLVQLVGRVLERNGEKVEAEALYNRYFSEHPESRVLMPMIVRMSGVENDHPVVASTADGVAEAMFDAASALGSQGTRETALVFGRLGIYLAPDFPMLQTLVASLLEAEGQLDQANEVYMSIDPSSPLGWEGRLSVAANLNEMGRQEEAVSRLKAMADERPDQAKPLIDLGDILRRQEKFEQAVAAYDQAFERIGSLEPRHWQLLYARGMALERAKLWARAEADFLKALEFEPDQPFVLNYLGYSWVEQGANLDQAMAMIGKAVELRPDDGYIVDSLGWVHYRLGNYPEAVDNLERAVELRPEDPVINDHLGDAYWAVGRRREAQFKWRAALSLGPEPELEAKIKQKLEQGLVKEANAGAHD